MLLVVVALFLTGWACGSRFSISPRWLQWGDRYVIHVALPALIVSKISQMDVTRESSVPVAVAWGSMMLCAVLLFVVGRRRAWSETRIGALLLVGVLGNTSFLGIEAVRSLLGEEYVAAAVTYDQLGTFLALTLYGSWIASRYGTGETGWKPRVSRIVRFTPFLALVMSLILREFTMSEVLIDSLGLVGLTVAPVAMTVLGLRFTLKWKPDTRWAVTVALIVKMAVVPTFFFLVGGLLNDVHSVAWSTSLLQTAAPPMVTAGIVAVSAGLEEELVVSIVGIGTLVSFVTLPLVSVIL